MDERSTLPRGTSPARPFATASAPHWPLSIIVAALLSLWRPAGASCLPPDQPRADAPTCAETFGRSAATRTYRVDAAEGALLAQLAAPARWWLIDLDRGSGRDPAKRRERVRADARVWLAPVTAWPTLVMPAALVAPRPMAGAPRRPDPEAGPRVWRSAVEGDDTATGLAGTAGDDRLANVGEIVSSANMGVQGVSAALNVEAAVDGSAIGLALVDAGIQATARSVGIDGRGGSDTVRNTGRVVAGAQSSAIAAGASVAVGIAATGRVTGAALAEAGVLSTATAIGIDGGPGDDRIVSRDVTATAQADATGVAASIAVSGSVTGAPAGRAAGDAGVTGEARAIGIRTGGGGDRVTIEGEVGVHAHAVATGAAVSVPVTVARNATVQADALSRTAVAATATGIGIDAGNGDDTLVLRGRINADASAEATGVAVAMSVAGSAEGGAGGQALSDASVRAQSAVTAVATRGGDDRIVQTGGIEGHATAIAIGVSAGLKLGYTQGGDVAAEARASGGALGDASSTAHAQADGIASGPGADSIANRGDVAMTATALATGVAASLDLAGTAQGLAAGRALTYAAVSAQAVARGVAAGGGSDTVVNTASLKATAEATGIGVSASVPVAIAKTGRAEGAAVANVGVAAAADASGIDTGPGTSRDEVHHRGAIEATGSANATGVAVALSVAGSVIGDVQGAALSDSSVRAASNVHGITTGAGHDEVTHVGTLVGQSTATAIGASASVKVGFTKQGDVEASATAQGAAMSRAVSEASAKAAGLDTGQGDDRIRSRGPVAVTSTATAIGVAASLDVAGSAKGQVGAAALSDASVTALAAARGIDAGDGTDAVTNTARIDATASAIGVGVSASVPVSISKGGNAEGSAVSKTSVEADAIAIGLDTGGDRGADAVINTGAIAAGATSTATGVAASITVAGTAKGDVKGSALSDSSTTAAAAATGLATARGDDAVRNEAGVDAISQATATGISASVRVGVTKDGGVEKDAQAEGSAIGRAASTAAGLATALDGGDGHDTIDNRGALLARATATATGVAASIDVAGSAKGDVAGGALADAAVTASAGAAGIAAGNGNDTVTNGQSISGDVVATATGAALGVSVSITKDGKAEGQALSKAGATAAAQVTGIDGGAGDDSITNLGTIRLQHLDGTADAAEARATAVAASVSVAGSAKGEVTAKALADASATATAAATGIAAGAGADTVSNAGRIVADLDAIATTVAASIGVAITVDDSEAPEAANATGSALSDASATAVAQSVGIDTGAGTNAVTNTGGIQLDSTAQSTSIAVSLTVGGTSRGNATASALSQASSTAQARSTGIAGGADDDVVANRAAIDASTRATATTVAASGGVAITLKGTASGTSLADSSATARATSIGLDGGAGVDQVENTAAITTAAHATATSVAVGVTVAGTAQADASGSALAKAGSIAESTAAALVGGLGDDMLTNRGALSVDAVATGLTTTASLSVAVTLDGRADNAALTDASSTARARAGAIDAGDGDDRVVNDGAIVLMPAAPGAKDGATKVEASAQSLAVSVTVTGAIGGDMKGQALSNASATADALATGIDAGAGNDHVTNTGTIAGAIDAVAKSVAVGANVAVTVGGRAQGAVASDARSSALARATGIAGGDGADTIDNAGAITLATGARADGVSLSVALGGSLGTSDQSALATARTTADALTLGLDGGAGHDRIDNRGALDVAATAALEGKSFAVNIGLLSGGLSTQSAVADVSGVTAANATGIAAGAGDDIVRHAATLAATASATAKTSAYTVNLSGLSVGLGIKSSLADARTTAAAGATGLDGGDGADDLGLEGTTTVHAQARSEGSATTRTLTITSLGGDLQAAAARSSTTAQAAARGLDGGAGDDMMTVRGTLGVEAQADVMGAATATSVTGLGIGATAQTSVAQAGTLADAQAVGVDGGAGGNAIDNAALITVGAIANGTTTSVSAGVAGFNLAGATYQDAAADASSAITAGAIGLRGGDGTDTIGNTAALTLTAKATGDVTSNAEVQSVTFFGSAAGKAAADASARIAATAVALDGGAGDDTLDNRGAIIVDAIAVGTTRTRSSANADVVFGSASAKSASSAAGAVEAAATGLAGGAGRDDVTSTALVDVGANATLTVTASAVSVTRATFGSAYAAAAADSSSTTRAAGTGLDGGDDADHLRNAGGVTVDVHATTTVSQTSVAIANSTFGSETTVANANAAATADARATGLAGGGGHDRIVSPAAVSATAHGRVVMRTLTLSSDGPATADARTQVKALAIGVDGGDGDDLLDVAGDVTVGAFGTVDSGRRIGGSKVDEDVRITVATRAVGLAGGAGDDTVTSAGTMSSTAESNLNAQSVTFVDLAVLKSRLTADASAIGIDGGDGRDVLRANTTLTVKATADVQSKQSTYSFGGGEGTAFLQAQSFATGFGAGGVLDVVSWQNAASTATSTVTAQDTSLSFGGYVSKELRGRALSTATGLQGGTGGDLLDNRARLSVTGNSSVGSTGKVEIVFEEGTEQQMGFEAIARALGTSTGEGDDLVGNAAAGVMAVGATATATVEGVTSSCDGLFGCGYQPWGNRKATFNWADALAEGSAVGVELGSGRDGADNAGEITVTATATANASAISNADRNGESEAYADGTARARAWGVLAAGTATVHQQAAATLRVTATATADVKAQGGKIGGTDVDLKSSVSESAAALGTTFVDSTQKDATSADLVGKWVRFLNGANVDAFARVTAFDPTTGTFTLDTALVHPLAKDDLYTLSEARNARAGAFGVALATGIELEGDAAVVPNDGVLEVTATARADIAALAFGGNSTAVASASAIARGILTGAGNDTVVNTGTIVVAAEAKAGNHVLSNGDMSASAIGIDTGEGDDRVVNEGTVEARTRVWTTFGIAQPGLGTAIATGAGRDHLRLGEASLTRGHVSLDDGDDVLVVQGRAAVVRLDGTPGRVDGGAGVDAVVFDGAGAFAAGLVGFEVARKQGAGTFAVPALPAMQQVVVTQGTLRIDGAYAFAPTGDFRPWIHGGRTGGTLAIEGASATLGGRLTVVKGRGAYRDGATYTVLQTTAPGGLTGAFDDVVLPSPTSLVRFVLDTQPEALQVRAVVDGYSKMANSEVERATAGYLDRLLPTVAGELSEVLGALQDAPAAQIGTSLAGLSPQSHDGATRTAALVTRQATQSVGRHLAVLRATGVPGGGGGVWMPGGSLDRPVLLAHQAATTDNVTSVGGYGGRLGVLPPSRRAGVWMDSFGERGRQSAVDGFSGVDYDMAGMSVGVDYAFSPGWMAGVSAQQARTRFDLADQAGDGRIRSTGASLYGTWFGDGVYVDGVVSYARQGHDRTRRFSAGGTPYTTSSHHHGRAFSALLGAGHDQRRGDWTIGSFGSLLYTQLQEGGYRETGAGSLDLQVEPRTTDTLVGQLGVRLAREIEHTEGRLVPEVRLAWNHDFGVGDRMIRAAFASAPGTSFTMAGAPVTGSGLSYAAGLTYVHRSGLATSLQFAGEHRDGHTSHGVQGVLRLSF